MTVYLTAIINVSHFLKNVITERTVSSFGFELSLSRSTHTWRRRQQHMFIECVLLTSMHRTSAPYRGNNGDNTKLWACVYLLETCELDSSANSTYQNRDS